MKKPNFKKIAAISKKVCAIFLIITLVLGITTTAYGVGSATLKTGDENTKTETSSTAVQEAVQPQEEKTISPNDQYKDLVNSTTLNDEVIVLNETASKSITSAIKSVSYQETYSNNIINIVLDGVGHTALDNISRGDVVFISGDDKSPLGGDRFLKIESISSYNGETEIRATEPYFEEVFKEFKLNMADPLSRKNFVKAYHPKGVTSHFGDVDKEMVGVAKTSDLGVTTAQPLGSNVEEPQVLTTATDYSTEGGDLIVKLDYDFVEAFNKDKKDEDKVIETSLKFTGQFGIKDLTAHMVVDAPTVLDLQNLYFGLSGETFVDISVNASIGASFESEASDRDKDNWLFSLEGLNEKLLPIAVFEFKGNTPVPIPVKSYEKKREEFFSYFIMLYMDFEGNISLTFTGKFNYSHSFNNGLSVYKNGEPFLTFENYPFANAKNAEDEDNLSWNASIGIDCNTDVTLFGCSALFYLAGINFCEISLARIGFEAQGKTEISIDSNAGVKILEPEDSALFLRMYLKIIEVKVKLAAKGKSFLEGLEIDVDFEFALLDITLFSKGLMPDKYKKAFPVSSMSPPGEFASVISLVCDVSGSMDSKLSSGQSKLEAAKAAAKTIVSTTENWYNTYNDNYGMGIIQFSSSAKTIGVPHIDFKYLNDCIDYMGDGGGTSIYSGIDAAISQLDSVKSSNKVIILMTDGQDGNTSKTLESTKNAASKKIKIYTIGFGDDVDEELLRDIASQTGGEYQYANSENTMGIIGSFMYAQHSTNADVITQMEGAVSEGETSSSKTFEVDGTNGDLILNTAWPGSFLDTILKDPNGRVVDENYPNATTDETKIPSTIIVKNPIKGTWSVAVKGIETSYEDEPFYTIVSFKASETPKINKPMNTNDEVSAYCIPIGIFVTITSAMLLFFVLKKKSDNEE